MPWPFGIFGTVGFEFEFEFEFGSSSGSSAPSFSHQIGILRVPSEIVNGHRPDLGRSLNLPE